MPSLSARLVAAMCDRVYVLVCSVPVLDLLYEFWDLSYRSNSRPVTPLISSPGNSSSLLSASGSGLCQHIMLCSMCR